MKAVTVTDVLHGAADIIETEGWCRGVSHRRIGDVNHYCAIGALAEASYRLQYYGGLEAPARVLLRSLRLRLDCGDVVRWNDAARDRRKIVRALRRAAREAHAAAL